jgi:hypothetical protein
VIFKLFSDKPQRFSVLGGPFKGATVFLNPKNSKRKLFGLYEHVLNDWIRSTADKVQFVFDVGANTGYDTYGFAHLLSKGNTQPTDIIAFEPEAMNFPELTTPRHWECYSKCSIEVIEKFAAADETETTTTLDKCFSDRSHLQERSGLIKIDVEGAEVEVLRGACSLLSNPKMNWLIEIHGKDLIPQVSQFFLDVNRRFLIKALSPLPFIGSEQRSIDTFWLVTI